MDRRERIRRLAAHIEAAPSDVAGRVLGERRRQVGTAKFVGEMRELEQAHRENRAARSGAVQALRQTFAVDTGSAGPAANRPAPPATHPQDYDQVLRYSGAQDVERRNNLGVARGGGW